MSTNSRASNYNKPLPASINTSPGVSPQWPINFGQIVRLVFQQPYNGSTTGSQFATMAAAQTLSNWTALIAATDATAMQYTPLMSNTKIGDSKELATAADSNLTFLGIPEYFGQGGAMFTGEFRSKDAPSTTNLANLIPFSNQNAGGQSNLSCYMVCNNGDVIAQGTQSGATITNIQPINFFNFWFAMMATEGYATGTTIKCGLWLPPYYSDNVVMIPHTPTFDLRLLS